MKSTPISRLTLATAISAMLIGGYSATAAADEPTCDVNTYAMGLRYQQQSAEIQALQMQTYALAKSRLQLLLAEHKGEKNLAIVTDLDETVIDNSALLVRDMKKCHDYTTWDTWNDWERNGNPTLIPGAKVFFDYADSQGVTIYYISDRYGETKDFTLETLKSLKLPQVNADQVLLYGTSKTERRARVATDHKILMLLGDSLPDFSGDFHHASMEKQHALVEQNHKRFGKDWIVLPNAGYGAWNKAKLRAWDAPLKTE